MIINKAIRYLSMKELEQELLKTKNPTRIENIKKEIKIRKAL